MDSYDNEVSSEIYFLAAHGKDTQEMMDELLNSDEYSSFGQIIDVMEEFISGNEGSQVNTPDVTKTVMDLQHTFAVPSLVSNN